MDRRIFMGAGIAGLVTASPWSVAFAQSAVPGLVINYSNRARKQAGRPALRGSTELQKAAAKFAATIARTGTFSHEAGGKGLKARLRGYGIRGGYMAENIAQRSPGKGDAALAQALVAGWMESKGHRRNLLHPKLTHIGVGLAQTSARLYAVQIFWGKG